VRRILIVDGDDWAAKATARRLERLGHDVSVAPEATAALRELYQSRPDVVILELVLPGMDGFETCRLIRSICDIPILILTSLEDELDVVRGFDLGADDYLVKPVRIGELASRIEAVLRRTRPRNRNGARRLGDVEIDIERGIVTKRGEPVSLTPTEARLLNALAERAGRLCTHEYLLDRVWGPGWGEAAHCLRLYIGYLRHKLEDDPSRPSFIINEWGAGYRLAAEVSMPVAGSFTEGEEVAAWTQPMESAS
jgi:DNA-binding response OmpR family regulator